jgi:hypothetical protein
MLPIGTRFGATSLETKLAEQPAKSGIARLAKRTLKMEERRHTGINRGPDYKS